MAMNQVVGGIKALSRAILDDTKGEAQRIVVEAQDAGRRMIEQANADAARIRREILTAAESQISHMEQQSMATARLEAQRITLTHREKLIDQVFQQAMAHLAQVPDESEYPHILEDLIVDAVAKLGQPSSATVRVAERDLPLISDEMLATLASQWQGRVQLEVGTPIDILGGVVVEVPQVHKRYDNSLTSRLRMERDRLRAEVYQLLQGGA